MRLLVTGAGRTGTTWLTRALRSCGIDARHEIAFNHRVAGVGGWSCEVSWLAAPSTPIADAHVVHLVRHPLEAIASRAAWGTFERRRRPGRYDPRVKGRWAVGMCPEIAEGTTAVERAAIHWARWNDMVAGADELLRIEDVDAAVVTRLARIVDADAGPAALGHPVNQSLDPPSLDWSDVDHVPGLIDQADEWGYLRCA